MLTSQFRSVKLLLLTVLLLSFSGYAQTTVNSLSALLPYLNDNNANVKLAPGTYTVTAADIDNGTFGNPILLFEGSNSTYDFTGVTINFKTEIFKKFGKVDVKEIQILGNYNVLKNLTMIDDGDVTDNPSKTALGIAMDGSNNRVEGFHMTVKGSWPYGYGDVFGKGGSNTVIFHYKHSALLVRGESNHVKNCTIIHRSYGHAIFMQAANNPLIEGCYVEGEMRTTDDILAEEGTGTRADDVDFMTTWGYRLPAGYMVSTGEEGIRAYNGGETFINGVSYSRGTSNPTVINCTVKNMRGGVTLAHATGDIYVEGCRAIGCEGAFGVGSGGEIVDCYADAAYGPVFKNAYDSDKNISAEITIMAPENGYYNGTNALAYFGGSNHDIVLKSEDPNVNTDLKIEMGGDHNDMRLLNGSNASQNNHSADNTELENYTGYAIILPSSSSGNDIITCGTVSNNGSNNSISYSNDCEIETTPTCSSYVSNINPPSNLVSGVAYNYYEGTWDVLPNFDSLTPEDSGVTSDINLSATTTSADYFGYTFEGYINVSSEGQYTFYTSSDDGSGLWINDNQVVYNDGLHGTVEKSAQVCLEAGYHKIYVEYFEKTGGNTLSVAYAGPGISKTTLTNLYTQDESISSVFPDPNKTYYIDSAYFGNTRLAASAESENPYLATTTTTGDDVEWKFVAKGNGSWHIQLASGGSKPRLRSVNDVRADMQPTSSSGGWTYFDITEGAIAGSYFITLPDGPGDYVRLQIDNTGAINMVGNTRNGTWESFTITEAGTTTRATDIRIEAEDYDAMSGIQTEASTESGENVGWINNGDWLRFDDVDLSGLSNMDARIACNFTGGTIEVRIGSTTGTEIGSITVTNTGGNQNWVTKNTAISNASGIQDVYLVFKGGSGYLFNVNWIEFNNSSTSNKDIIASAEEIKVLVYPNPVTSTTTIANAANSVITIYDMNGSSVFTQLISSESETIDLSGLVTGMYYGEVIGESSVAVVKVIKQ